MKAISLWQPHATLMRLGEKRIETRGKRMNHVGELAIHAAQRWLPDQRAIIESEPFRSRLAHHGITPDNVVHDLMPRGAIVCVVDALVVYTTEEILKSNIATAGFGITGFAPGFDELAFGDYSPGRYGFLTTNLRPLRRPVLCRGMQAVPFTLPPDVEAQVRAELAWGLVL